jgi:hypothetical protein
MAKIFLQVYMYAAFRLITRLCNKNLSLTGKAPVRTTMVNRFTAPYNKNLGEVVMESNNGPFLLDAPGQMLISF